MKFAITFGTLSMRTWLDAAVAADRLGFDSVWLPEHLVLPIEMAGSPYADTDHPPVPPETPIHDVISFLSYMAAKTERVRLGTYVYLLGLRHPFISARGWATLNLLSGGRAILGAGAGWLESEWRAAGIDPASRGARLDEAIDVCRLLWTDEIVEFHGDHFDFGPVAFEPKPGRIPIHIGGEGPRALRRVARRGDGWLAMHHEFDEAETMLGDLDRELAAAGRSRDEIEITLSGPCESPADIERWESLGVGRLIVRPWVRSADALESMEKFADTFGLDVDH